MDMKSSTWSLLPTYYSAQLTHYDYWSGMKNRFGIVSMINVTIITQCTTYPLWFPEQNKEWRWNHQHDHCHQYASRHNSPTTISRIGGNMVMVSLAWSLLPTSHTGQLTHYNCHSKIKNGHVIISMTTVTNAKLTSYKFQRRTKIGYGIISIITVTKYT